MAGIVVKFYTKPVELTWKTEKEGRAFFEDQEFVDVIFVGEKNTEGSWRVNDIHRLRWPEEYARFKAGARQQSSGTPLSEWGRIAQSQVKELEYLNVFTVEDLANCDDSFVSRFGMGGRELIVKAKAFLDSTKGTAAVQNYAVENDRMKARMAELEEKLALLAAQADSSKDDPEEAEAKMSRAQALERARAAKAANREAQSAA